MGEMYLYRRNFLGGFYGVLEQNNGIKFLLGRAKLDISPLLSPRPGPRAAARSRTLFRRGKIGQIYLYRTTFIGGFYGASEIFLTARKTTV